MTDGSVTVELVGPSLSWTSSGATMSGERRLWTMRSASRSYLATPSPGSRFSTLNVATAARALRRLRRLAGQPAGDDHGGLRDEELEVCKRVVEDADRIGLERVADVYVRRWRPARRRGGSARVRVVRPQDDAPREVRARPALRPRPGSRRKSLVGPTTSASETAISIPSRLSQKSRPSSEGSKSTPPVSTSPDASSSITSSGGRRSTPTTVVAGSVFPVEVDGHSQARGSQLSRGQVFRRSTGRNSATVPRTVTAAPTGAVRPKTRMPSEVAGSASGVGSWT